jgi:hypothetical protein
MWVRLAPTCALDLWDDRRHRVAVVRIARQRLGVGDELAALGMMERRGDRNLDAELTWAFIRQAYFIGA